MPRTAVRGPQNLKSMLAQSTEIEPISRRLASLALAQVAQDGALNVRQNELLRRHFATAGEALGWVDWAGDEGDSVLGVGKDVATMTKGGARALARDLKAELASKQVEVAQIEKTAATILKLSENSKTAYPVEVTYHFTVRDSSAELVTKTDTLTLEGPTEAASAAANVEKTIPSKTKLADLMILDIKEKQVQIDVIMKGMSDFVESSHQLLREVILNLQ